MTVVESIIAAIERIVLPKLQEINTDVKVLKTQMDGLRELMEQRFKAVEQRFDALEDKLAPWGKRGLRSVTGPR